MNFLSTNIRHLRLSNNMTQEDFANVVNKSRVLVSQWESDEREITTEDIIKISNYFNIPMDILVGSDLRLNNESQKMSQRELLFNKTKDLLSDSDWATIEFIMNKTINDYEKNKKEG